MISRLRAAWMHFRQPMLAVESTDQAYWLGFRAAEEKVNLRYAATMRDYRIREEIAKATRGVIVSRITAEGLSKDAYPDGNAWAIVPTGHHSQPVGLLTTEDDSVDEAWLHVYGSFNEQIATYKPGYWFQVESGKLEDITEIKEGETPTT